MSEPLVLLYHHLCRTPCAFTKHLEIHCHTRVFERHIRELSAQRQVVALSEIPSLREPEKCAAIYFDDGYYSIYRYALPIIMKYRIPVAIFLNPTAITDGLTWLNKLSWLFETISLAERSQLAYEALPSRTSSGPPVASEFVHLFDQNRTPFVVDSWWRRRGAPRPESPLFLGAEEIRQLAACELFTFGSHSLNHYPLDRLDTTMCRDEIVEGHRVLEQLIPDRVRGFSVPFARLGKPTILKTASKVSTLIVVAKRDGRSKPKAGRFSFVYGTTVPRRIRSLREVQKGDVSRVDRGRLPAGVALSWVRFSELATFANTLDRLPPYSLIPISRQRASLMASHPYGSKDAVALVLVWNKEGAVIGYWGLFPGALSDSRSHVLAHFASTGMVHPDLRGRGVPAIALREIKQCTDILCVVGTNRDANRMFNNLGLEQVTRQQGYSLNLRCVNPRAVFTYCLQSVLSLLGRGHDSSVAPVREVSLQATPYVFKTAAALGVLCGGQRFSAEAQRLLESPSGARWYRSAEAIEWMADNSWEGPKAPLEGRENEYHFSRRNLTVRYIRCEIGEGQTRMLGGAGLIQVVANHHRGITIVRGLDTVISDRIALAKYLFTLVGIAIAHRADRVELPKQCTPQLLQKLFPRLVVCPVIRKYYYWTASPEYKELIERADASLCDGDLGLY